MPATPREVRVNLNGTPSHTDPTPNEVGLFPIGNPDRTKVKTLDDLALSRLSLKSFPDVEKWRKQLFSDEGRPKICHELPENITRAMRDTDALKNEPKKRRAKVVAQIFSEKKPLIGRSSAMPGQTTTSLVGPVAYMDTIGYCIWPELDTVSTRAQNPYDISEETARKLNQEIFPYWLQRRPAQEVARYSAYDTADYAKEYRDRVAGESEDPALKKAAGETPKCQELMERVAFFLSDKATAVSHTVPDFQRLLDHGLQGLKEQMVKDLSGLEGEPKSFLEGVIGVFDGAMGYAAKLAAEAQNKGNMTLFSVCGNVPAKGAETLHEALASIWICYHLLLQENTNFGLSIGRLDQLLNPYYMKEWERLETEAEKNAYVDSAVELVCHFFLSCSDHVPLSTEGSETLFAGSGSNQALTVGGVKVENGVMKDAVNDMTYIILKATEILAIRDPNVHARVHTAFHGPRADGTPSPYLQRVSQVNILTRATPAIHGDVPVIETMANYYAQHDGVDNKEALADAADYASIGCIEQNAAGKHYGHTGSSLVVLPAILELAMFGGKHRSDGIGPQDPNLFQGTPNFTTTPLTQMTSMAQFIDAFEVQMDAMARHVVQNNNYLGRAFEQMRGSPFLSGLFTGPTNLPGQSGAAFRDLTAGGAKYNSAGVAIIGLADVIDAFCVIDSLIFNGPFEAHDLINAMEADFTPGKGGSIDNDRLAALQEAIRKTPKYGAGVETEGENDNGMALEYANRLVKLIDKVFFRYRTHRGGRYLAGYWSMTNHAGFGMLTQATPNGRKAGEAFAGGITPCPNIVKPDGKTPIHIRDHMLSVAAIDSQAVRNGYTYNLSLTPRGPAHCPADTREFSGYMHTYLKEGGMLVQLCVSSIDHLQKVADAADAVEAGQAGEEQRALLEANRPLMIRVAGYSAYFVTLSPQMRKEVIERANFSLADGDKLSAHGGN